MARISFNLTLGSADSDKEEVITLSKPISLLDLLAKMNVNEEEVGFVVRNGRWENINFCMVENGDHIELFPPLHGG